MPGWAAVALGAGQAMGLFGGGGGGGKVDNTQRYEPPSWVEEDLIDAKNALANYYKSYLYPTVGGIAGGTGGTIAPGTQIPGLTWIAEETVRSGGPTTYEENRPWVDEVIPGYWKDANGNKIVDPTQYAQTLGTPSRSIEDLYYKQAGINPTLQEGRDALMEFSRQLMSGELYDANSPYASAYMNKALEQFMPAFRAKAEAGMGGFSSTGDLLRGQAMGDVMNDLYMKQIEGRGQGIGLMTGLGGEIQSYNQQGLDIERQNKLLMEQLLKSYAGAMQSFANPQYGGATQSQTPYFTPSPIQQGLGTASSLLGLYGKGQQAGLWGNTNANNFLNSDFTTDMNNLNNYNQSYSNNIFDTYTMGNPSPATMNSYFGFPVD